eukprot:Ihof_evm5s71 gene=Ihof_evmTU5s71
MSGVQGPHSSGSALQAALFSVRVVCHDVHMTPILPCYISNEKNISEIDVTQLVPVIRLFGATPAGQRACVHIHDVFPYFFVLFDEANVTVMQPDDIDLYIEQLQASIERAMNLSLGRKNEKNALMRRDKRARHVLKIIVVKGRPFYGYHPVPQFFLKVYMYNPFMISRAVSLLQSGAVMGRAYQPYESHISFLLQFCMDYNIYPMNFIHLSSIKFRGPFTPSTNIRSEKLNGLGSGIPVDGGNDKTKNVGNFGNGWWRLDHLPREYQQSPNVPRESVCELELDVHAHDILNRGEIDPDLYVRAILGEPDVANSLPLGVSLPSLSSLSRSTNEKAITLVYSLTHIWKDEQLRREEKGISSQVTRPPSQDRPTAMLFDVQIPLYEHLNTILDSVPSQSALSSPHDGASLAAGGVKDTSDIKFMTDAMFEMLTDLDREGNANVHSNEVYGLQGLKKGVEQQALHHELNEIVQSQGVLEDNLPSQTPILCSQSNEVITFQDLQGYLHQARSPEETIEGVVDDLAVQTLVDLQDIDDDVNSRPFEEDEVRATSGRKNGESDSDSNDEGDEIWLSSQVDEETIMAMDQPSSLPHPLTSYTDTTFETHLSFKTPCQQFPNATNDTRLNESNRAKIGHEKELSVQSGEDKGSPREVTNGMDWNIEQGIPQYDGSIDVFDLPIKESTSHTCRLISYNNLNKINYCTPLALPTLCTPRIPINNRIQLLPANPAWAPIPQYDGMADEWTEQIRMGLTKRKKSKIEKAHRLKEEHLPPSVHGSAIHHSQVRVNSSDSFAAVDLQTDRTHKISKSVAYNTPKPSQSNMGDSKAVTGQWQQEEMVCPMGLDIIEKRKISSNITHVNDSVNTITTSNRPIAKHSEYHNVENEHASCPQKIPSKLSSIDTSVTFQEKISPSITETSSLLASSHGNYQPFSTILDPIDIPKVCSPTNGRVSSATAAGNPTGISTLEKALHLNLANTDNIAPGTLNSPDYLPGTPVLSQSPLRIPSTVQVTEDNIHTVLTFWSPIADDCSSPSSPPRLISPTSSSYKHISNEKVHHQNVLKYTVASPVQSLPIAISHDNNHLSLHNPGSSNPIQLVCDRKPLRTSPVSEDTQISLVACTLFSTTTLTANATAPVPISHQNDKTIVPSNRISAQESLSPVSPGRLGLNSSTDEMPKGSDKDAPLLANSQSIMTKALGNFNVNDNVDVNQISTTPIHSDGIVANDSPSTSFLDIELSEVVNSCVPGTQSDGEDSSMKEKVKVNSEISLCLENELDGTHIGQHNAPDPMEGPPSVQRNLNSAATFMANDDKDDNNNSIKASKADNVLGTLVHDSETLVSESEHGWMPPVHAPNDFIEAESKIGFTGVNSEDPAAIHPNNINDDTPQGLPKQDIVMHANLSPPFFDEVNVLIPDSIAVVNPDSQPLPCQIICDTIDCLHNPNPDIIVPKSLPVTNNEGEYHDKMDDYKPMDWKIDRSGYSSENVTVSSSYHSGGLKDSHPSYPMINKQKTTRVLRWCAKPPTLNQLKETLLKNSIPEVVPVEAFYETKDTNGSTVMQVVYGGQSFAIPTNSLKLLKPFESDPPWHTYQWDCLKPVGTKRPKRTCHVLTPVHGPPSAAQCALWLKKNTSCSQQTSSMTPVISRQLGSWPLGSHDKQQNNQTTTSNDNILPGTQSRPCPIRKPDSCQIEGPTYAGTHQYKLASGDIQHLPAIHYSDHLTTLSLEIHANSRGSKLPDPVHDMINLVAYCIHDDDLAKAGHPAITGIIIVTDTSPIPLRQTHVAGHPIKRVETELQLFDMLKELIGVWDPDILLGFNIQSFSWGYLIDRALAAFQLDLCGMLARTPLTGDNKFSRDDDPYGYKKGSGLHISGRISLSAWRLMRGELSLTSYTYENLVYHILHQRVPKYTYETLTKWYRAVNSLRMLARTGIVERTSELARVFGIDFQSVLFRGTQYRVESMLLRLAKPMNFIAISPSRPQVVAMASPECVPLVMEPKSDLYTSPVLVLDFQSLYPSMVIAYNLCYSTCLGKLSSNESKKLGVKTNYKCPFSYLKSLQKDIFIAPNRVMFVNKKVQVGLLPRLLDEILQTRFMVKQSMGRYKNDNALYRLLDHRQMALKLIANVTFGYTAATFSGRMPCVDIADAIVQTGRMTLERCIRRVEEHWKQYGVKVVYGDTDSVFVMLPGASKDTAFRVGNEIAADITAQNPKPVKLKFEKVYYPCILASKKRYVGYMYETPDQKDPVLDSKGIETVRRDGCPAVSKILEKALKVLFDTRNLSDVKSYVQRQWRKIQEGRVSVQDFIIAKEVKLGSYRFPDRQPVAVISARAIIKDPRAEPRYNERVPYVVVYTVPGARLIDNVMTPEEMMLGTQFMRLNATYYITKMIIPALDRAFALIGVDVSRWYSDMPRYVRVAGYEGGSTLIDHFYRTLHCLVCDALTTGDHLLCERCMQDKQATAYYLGRTLNRLESSRASMQEICFTCTAVRDDIECVSLDCPVFYERIK